MPSATGLRDGTSRLDVLGALVPALRKACGRIGFLDADELREFAARDLARGRPCTHPARGIVRGVTPAGELIVDEGSVTRHYRAGSLVLQEAP